jgi:hypothetical protein
MKSKKKESKFVAFILRYFTRDTKKEDRWLSRVIISVLLVLFILGFIGAYLENESMASGFMVLFSGGLAVLWIGLFTAALIHRYITRNDTEE